MSKLSKIRAGIKQELETYPQRSLDDVKWHWRWTGIFGGHRAYLGHDLIANAMALTFGGLGVWWLLDRYKLKSMTDEWNADQAQRKESDRPPKEIDGLVLADPISLEKTPEWINDAKAADELMVEGIKSVQEEAMTQASAMQNTAMKASQQLMDSIPMPKAQRELMRKQAELQGKVMDLGSNFQQAVLKYGDQIQLAMFVGMASYITSLLGAFEVPLLLLGLCIALAFTHRFVDQPEGKLRDAVLEWDYLLCSYYHANKSPMFLVALMRSSLLFLPRLFGFGSVGEATLFNRLSGAASAVCFFFIPIELLFTMIGDEPFSLFGFIGGTLLSIMASIVVMAMYVPVIGGTLSRHKLLSENTELKIAGSLGAAAALIGGLLGSLGLDWLGFPAM